MSPVRALAIARLVTAHHPEGGLRLLPADAAHVGACPAFCVLGVLDGFDVAARSVRVVLASRPRRLDVQGDVTVRLDFQLLGLWVKNKTKT